MLLIGLSEIKKELYCAFLLVYSKEFNYVVRDNLWYKLLKL